MFLGLDTILHKPLWQLIWDVTHDCNLRCSYCTIEKEKNTRTSYEKALNAISQLEPKILLLTGGEPTVLPNFISLLQQIRGRLPRVNLYLNTNGINVNVLLKSVDSLDGILFSLDGLGEINRTLRGVEGEKIITNLRTLSQVISVNGKPKLLKVMTVVTRTNFPFLRELLEEVATIGTGIEVMMKPLLPYTHPDSIASTPEGLESYFQFWEKNRTRFNFWVYGLFSPEQFHAPLVCFAQFFFSQIDHRENVIFCNFYKKQPVGRDYRIIPTPCPHPCDCKEYIDEILFGKSLREISPNAKLVLKLLSLDDLQKAEQFIQTYLDPNYQMELLKMLSAKLSMKNGQ